MAEIKVLYQSERRDPIGPADAQRLLSSMNSKCSFNFFFFLAIIDNPQFDVEVIEVSRHRSVGPFFIFERAFPFDILILNVRGSLQGF